MGESEIYRVTGTVDIVFRYLDLCIGIRLKPSYAQEDSRVTAPAGP